MRGLKLCPYDPPCPPECPERKAGCHSNCERYKAYRKKADENMVNRHENAKEFDYFQDRHLKYLDSEARRKKRGRK